MDPQNGPSPPPPNVFKRSILKNRKHCINDVNCARSLQNHCSKWNICSRLPLKAAPSMMTFEKAADCQFFWPWRTKQNQLCVAVLKFTKRFANFFLHFIWRIFVLQLTTRHNAICYIQNKFLWKSSIQKPQECIIFEADFVPVHFYALPCAIMNHTKLEIISLSFPMGFVHHFLCC